MRGWREIWGENKTICILFETAINPFWGIPYSFLGQSLIKLSQGAVFSPHIYLFKLSTLCQDAIFSQNYIFYSREFTQNVFNIVTQSVSHPLNLSTWIYIPIFWIYTTFVLHICFTSILVGPSTPFAPNLCPIFLLSYSLLLLHPVRPLGNIFASHHFLLHHDILYNTVPQVLVLDRRREQEEE